MQAFGKILQNKSKIGDLLAILYIMIIIAVLSIKNTAELEKICRIIRFQP